MKNILVILKVVGLGIGLFFFVLNVREMRIAIPRIHKSQAQVDQAWNNLRQASPLLAEKYDRAIKQQQEAMAEHSSYELWGSLLALPLSLLLANLFWQFVFLPIRTWYRSKQPRPVAES